MGNVTELTSLSARRAWIEMATVRALINCNVTVALRKESVDRNVINEKPVTDQDGSLSARRAWIEMYTSATFSCVPCVALRKESVDRNIWGGRGTGKTYGVALRKESVDRNTGLRLKTSTVPKSLSARRAWIEILARHRAGPQK